jgi:hypothetical protein
MSKRLDEVKSGGSKSPASKFIEWKSNDRVFSYYDRDKKENVAIPLPFKFVFLKEMVTIKGWHDASESGIFSNEVKFTSKEELDVKSFKGGSIAKGLYKDIKQKVVEAGGRYHKSVYVMLADGTLANLSFKGSVVKAWGDFSEKCKNRLPLEWITIKDVTEGKKGSIKYTTPNFWFSGTTSNNDSECLDVLFDELEAHFNGTPARVADVEEDEELPF